MAPLFTDPACRILGVTNSLTSSLLMTSKMPSHAKSNQSPGAQLATVITSGIAVTLQFSGASVADLNWKSPSARLVAKAPSTRKGPPPRVPASTVPPAASNLHLIAGLVVLGADELATLAKHRAGVAGMCDVDAILSGPAPDDEGR
eukprot:CAMPEP_0180487838 /NCGR_PEP_ID=MMETSP1036_2-20121128/37731_1 /TAXON_ID=632150 /ORGANISM="Azadinium spinosum, Strain 3D9" /LENGTH=145 /DNA_ID=CAMNT_0022495863 /DNA_START=435 /DNA_END=868 /DNA_ORIENTATION=+